MGKFSVFAYHLDGAITLYNPGYRVDSGNDLERLIKYASSKKIAKRFPFYYFKFYEGEKLVHSFRGKD